MGKYIDLTGKKFGRLTVIERAENKGKSVMWVCKCECKNITIVRPENLRSGRTQSCGCLHSEQLSNRNIKHGKSNTRLYTIWESMKSRCLYKSHARFKDYGGRGITVCNEWIHDFQTFYDWSMANGYAENLTIDRINNDKGYSPDNCRWVTIKEQENNKRSNHKITYKGETHNIKEWADILEINHRVIRKRISVGWSVERAFTTPVSKKGGD